MGKHGWIWAHYLESAAAFADIAAAAAAAGPPWWGRGEAGR